MGRKGAAGATKREACIRVKSAELFACGGCDDVSRSFDQCRVPVARCILGSTRRRIIGYASKPLIQDLKLALPSTLCVCASSRGASRCVQVGLILSLLLSLLLLLRLPCTSLCMCARDEEALFACHDRSAACSSLVDTRCEGSRNFAPAGLLSARG
ncbi:hypothetical protein IE81DRAFT_47845 [Ceraceosorus guamensis]|uniref:Uncharacterized protein n=1 Tax=Ceraceosorus guamensis TaxID=1522189 RepID=A0A316W340_9BASI|nr:hypothetical protein IE81DRAFT_47845 [Ceraceosorus guamensis]PWN44109.1 hypothetical protein IE81DRAFT_47845 [Ceraceosorus guamensis]